MRVWIVPALILLSAAMIVAPAPQSFTQTNSAAAPLTTWTIMVYMADDYAVSLNWQDDINEMEAASQAPGTNVIVLVDAYGSSNSVILKVANDPNFLNDTIVSSVVDDGGAVISGGEVDMASPTTLESFVEFSAQAFPADRLVLILWGHGASWRGLCPDGGDVLTLPELRTGLSNAVTSIGRPLDMVVVDSCAEASVEMLTQLRGLATVFVGSEKDVPFQGLPYVLVMNDLASNAEQGPVRLGSRIVDDYVTWSTSNSDYSVTMGVFNLTRMDDLLEDLGVLSAAGTRYDQLFHASMRASLESSEQYEEPFRIDLGDLMGRLSAADLPLEIKSSALQCILDADRVVEHFAKYSNLYSTDDILVTNATGLTIYPASTDIADSPYADLDIAWTAWADFGISLRNSTIPISSEPGPIVTVMPTGSADPPELWPWERAYLSWPESYERVAAVVYRHAGDALVYDSQFESWGPEIEFDIPGVLTVAASADIGDHAVSYTLLNLTVGGRDTLLVSLTKDGEPILDMRNDYSVEITKPGGSVLSGGYSTSHGDGTYVCSIDIPQTAETGDRLLVEIRERDSGALVGISTTTVGSEITRVQIQIWNPIDRSDSIVVPALFAALPGVLVLCYAVLVYRQQRKKL